MEFTQSLASRDQIQLHIYKKFEGSEPLISISNDLILPCMISSVIALAVPGALQIPCPWVRMAKLHVNIN